jgi:hypothetical protein
MKRGTERILTTQPAAAVRSAADDHEHSRIRFFGSHAFNQRAVHPVRPRIRTRAEAQIAIPLLSKAFAAAAWMA